MASCLVWVSANGPLLLSCVCVICSLQKYAHTMTKVCCGHFLKIPLIPSICSVKRGEEQQKRISVYNLEKHDHNNTNLLPPISLSLSLALCGSGALRAGAVGLTSVHWRSQSATVTPSMVLASINSLSLPCASRPFPALFLGGGGCKGWVMGIWRSHIPPHIHCNTVQ